MPVYTPPLRDYRFLLRDVLQIETYAKLPGFADAGPELIDQILDGAGQFAADVIQPLNVIGDSEGCRRDAQGSVTTPTGFKQAYQQLVDGGWPALGCDPTYGGQGLPQVLNACFQEMMSSANMAFAMYPGLSHGAYSALLHHGAQALKDKYLPKLVSGEWTGTMNLTEPHAGTDLGLLRTKAVPDGGGYRISGQKIFISAGEHDLAANIIHLVLARIEGAPEGTRGISLFVVPKVLVNDDGSLGARNQVTCGKLEAKMGIHGNATCVLNYDGAAGWLVGQEGRGLNAMFTMMNEARLGVGIQGLAQSEVAYQNGAAYARERLQGRALTGAKFADKPADPIIVHPDVRRMLMDAKSFNEGARAFALWLALQGDLATKSPDEAVRQKADDALALMTPVLKSYLTAKGFATAVDSQQIFGGHGFIEETGVSQFVRDARIAMIYEGANGVQALDLVGRKLAANGGRGVFAFFAEVDAFVAESEGDEALAAQLAALTTTKALLQEGTQWLMANAMSNFENAGAASHDYLNLFGVTALAYMWARMAKAALAAKASGSGDVFYDAKLATGRYFAARVAPEAAVHLAKVKAGAATLMALPAEAF